MTSRGWRGVVVMLAVLMGTTGVGSLIGARPAHSAAPYYSPSGVDGSIYRLYRAYFLREPEESGFLFWYLRVARGTSLDAVSDRFAASSEFRTRYGDLGNEAFVELIYRNVLGRDADARGRDYWTGRLNAGVTRGRVMRFFSESHEYQHTTATGVPPGWRAGSNASTLLAHLTVADEAPRAGYNPDLFNYWDDVDHDGCDTRCEVLGAEKRTDGTWFSWWDGKLVSVADHLDVDHVVSLAEAWDSGASTWNEARREAFANAQDNLVAVSRSSAAAKGDNDAAGWVPPRAKSGCLFAELTITTKFRWGLSVDPAERSELRELLDGCTRTTSDPPPVTGPPQQRRNIILYGDSISTETDPIFRWFIDQSKDYVGVSRVFPGTAPCSWFSNMANDRDHLEPAVVVMQFSAAAFADCMKDRDLLNAYRKDVPTATHTFTDAGIPVVWVSTPLRDDTYPVPEINTIEHDAALKLGQTYIDAGAAVLDNGQFTRTLPCLANETTSMGCTDGRIVVRSPDGAHLCPVQELPCPVYSSGALRYGGAQADAALRRLAAKRTARTKEPTTTTASTPESPASPD